MHQQSRWRLPLLTLALTLVLSMTAWAGDAPKNVVIMIGDGMGFAQVALTRLSISDSRAPLNMDSMTYGGCVRTYSANSVITDSAAASTALATGYKTNNGMIGTLPDGKSVPTILELLQKKGKAVGLLTTTTITHATPAGFGSHVSSRGDEADIAPQYIDRRIDVLMGGGRSFFIPKEAKDSGRKDSRDVLKEAVSAGYTVAGTRDELMAAHDGRVLGLFGISHLTTERPEPTLAEMTSKALELLSSDKDGFFLMVEGGQIDFRCHGNDARGAVKQTIDFDDAIGRVLEFARKHGDTLVIVTADHETGGLTLCYPEPGSALRFAPKFATTGHSGVEVPIFAEGPGARSFTGLLNNTDIPKRIARLCGLGELAPARAAAARQ